MRQGKLSQSEVDCSGVLVLLKHWEKDAVDRSPNALTAALVSSRVCNGEVRTCACKPVSPPAMPYCLIAF